VADLNKVMILGNVGKDPEVRYTPNGAAQASFTVAANRNYRRPDGEWEKETEWFNVVAWKQLAERLSTSVQKGDRVYVEGRLHTRSWDGQDGKRQYRTEVIADKVLPQGRRQPVDGMNGARGDSGFGVPAAAGGGFGGGGGDYDMSDPDDLPFD